MQEETKKQQSSSRQKPTESLLEEEKAPLLKECNYDGIDRKDIPLHEKEKGKECY